MIYLDNAATTFPKPRAMVKAMNQCILGYCGNPGRSGHKMSLKTGEEVYKARKEIGELFHIEEGERIVFTANATEALNTGIKGFLKPGDHVVTTSMEHNSVLRPLKALEKKGIHTSIVRGDSVGYVSAEKIERELREDTKLIACTHASNVTGTIMPIEAIGKMAKRRGVAFLVDASQSAGSVPIHVGEMNIDLLALPGHKGLLGPLGTGILYVAPSIALTPLKEGGTGTNSRDLRQPLDFPEGFESGTVNAPGIIGLGCSVSYLRQLGTQEISRYETYLVELLEERLRNMEQLTIYGPLSASEKTGIVTFNIEGMECEAISFRLDTEYNIAVRAGFHCAGLAHKTVGTIETGGVRISVGPYNTKKEMSYAADAIYQIAKRS